MPLSYANALMGAAVASMATKPDEDEEPPIESRHNREKRLNEEEETRLTPELASLQQGATKWWICWKTEHVMDHMIGPSVRVLVGHDLGKDVEPDRPTIEKVRQILMNSPHLNKEQPTWHSEFYCQSWLYSRTQKGPPKLYTCMAKFIEDNEPTLERFKAIQLNWP